MKNLHKLSLIFLSAIMICVALSGVEPVFAEKSARPIDLDLTLPRKPESGGQEDVIEEKYREILGEVSISEQAKDIAENIKDMVATLEDISMEVLVIEVKGERSDFVGFWVGADIKQKLARVEFYEPSALRGQIAVVDQEKMETKMFQPVVNQISVWTLEDMSKEALSALNVTDITTYFDFTRYHIVVLETLENDGVQEYLLQVDALEKEAMQIRVRDDTWLPHEIVVFEDGILAGKILLGNVVLNPGFEPEQLLELPDVKEVRM